MKSITRKCQSCGKYYITDSSSGNEESCPHCGQKSKNIEFESINFLSCIICDCKAFYKQKDFNQALGCFIVLIGAVLVPVTYGLSLPILVMIDWVLYRKTNEVIICYNCKSEFRGFYDIPQTVTKFDHHTGELYEKD